MPQRCGAMTPASSCAGVGAVAFGDEAVDPQEQPHLVGGGDAGLEQRADAEEVAHLRRVRDRLEAEVADAGVDRVGRLVVGRGDHRLQQCLLARAERAGGRAAQDRDHQHRLGHAGRAELGVGVEAADPAVLGHHREGDDALAGGREALRVRDARRSRRAPARCAGPAPRCGRRRARRCERRDRGEREEPRRRGRCGSAGAGRPARRPRGPRPARSRAARCRAPGPARPSRTSP